MRGPTTSHQAVGLEPGLDRLSGLVGRVLAEAGLSGAGAPRLPVAEVAVCCLAGMDLPSDEARLGQAYAARRARARRPCCSTTRSRRCGPGRPTAGAWPSSAGRASTAWAASRDGRVARFAGAGRDRRRPRRRVGARDVGAGGGGPGGRRPRTGDQPVLPGAGPFRAARAGRRDRGDVPRDRSTASGWGSWPRSWPRRRATATPWRSRWSTTSPTSSRRSRRRRSGGWASRPRPCPVTLAGGLARGAADLLVPRVAAIGPRGRAGRRGLRAARTAGPRRGAARA